MERYTKKCDDEEDVRPITPTELYKRKCISIPKIVFKAFNLLIVENWDEVNKRSMVFQWELVEEIMKINDETKGVLRKEDILKKRYLDVEEFYRQVGWDVQYEKPSIGDSYDPFFVFSLKNTQTEGWGKE